MARFLRKLYLLTWKNLKVLQRHYIKTAFEILIPIALFGLIAWINSMAGNNSEVKHFDTPTYFAQYNESDIVQDFPREYAHVYYTPANNFTQKLMEDVRKRLDFNRLTPCTSEIELENLYRANYKDAEREYERVIGVVFTNADKIPKKLEYRIRTDSSEWRTYMLFPVHQRSGPMESSELYFRTGFIALQQAIDWSFINNVKPKNALPLHYYVEQFPYPPYTVTDTSEVMSIIIGSCFVFGYTILCTNIVGKIVEEKQTGVTELLKLMGLSQTMLWVTWFVRVFIVKIIIVSVTTFFLMYPFDENAGAVFANSSCSLIWVFFIVLSVAVTMFWFAITTFFTRANFAVLFGAILWVLMYTVPKALLDNYAPVHVFWKLVSSLFPGIGLYWGITVIETLESRRVGLQWSNIFTSPSGSPGELNMANVFTMLFFDIIFYGCITWYMDSIMPGPYGIPKPFNFFCTKSYWATTKVEATKPSYGSGDSLLDSYESAPHGLKVGIRIHDLCKEFKGKAAVDRLTLDIYQDQITALLGHNGAGKTTTMSIITGMLPATSGSVCINDYNIRTDMAKVRESLGLCPQHDMLFADLTVKEHLLFFGMLKGMSYSEAQSSVEDFLRKMQLSEKANSMAGSLSGGMKRKLSLGIALIGDSKVVILDEPTSGLDPEARRYIWDLLLGMRGQRTILITTHFMEEADVLGDRIAIMDHGRVQCYGTSLFLKNRYGAGYVLKLLTQGDPDVSEITRLIETSLPGARLKSRLGSELAYILPLETKPQFPLLFNALESAKQALGIASVGVSLTTLEDVFLQVGHTAAGDVVRPTSADSDKSLHGTTKPKSFGLDRLVQQLQALLIKKIIYTRRTWASYLSLTLFAMLFMVGTLLLSNLLLGVKTATEKPPRIISLDQYPASSVLFTSATDPATLWYDRLAKSLGSATRSVPARVGLCNALLEVAVSDLSTYRNEYVVAAEFNVSASRLSVAAMYSGFGYHSAPISVNLLNNALLRSYMGDQYSISTINHPLLTFEEIRMQSNANAVGLLWQMFIPFGLMFVVGTFVGFPLVERVSSAKQLQLMSGVRPASYWFTCFAWDFLIYLSVSALMVVMLPIFDTHGYFGGAKEAGVFALLLVMYGFSGIPFAYVFSYFRSTAAQGLSLFVGLNFVFGMIFPWVISILEVVLMVYPDWATFIDVLKKILYLLPQFSISFAVMNFSEQAVMNNECLSMSEDTKKAVCVTDPSNHCCFQGADTIAQSYTAYDSNSNPLGIGWPLTMLAVDTVFYMALILLIDHGFISRLREKVKRMIWKQSDGEDEVDADVRIEIDRVHEGGENALTVSDLMKAYGRKMLAVKGVSFGVKSGECFGLLGFNGAGKTTTFKMLTGDERPTRGDARIKGHTLSGSKAQFLSQIGYCPQFDAINEVLTGREMLALFARLRGLHRQDVDPAVDKWIKLMGLEEYQDVRCGKYSGGNKRKLSTAMALIGDPPLIFLDEPTTGVDPVARRNLWSVLARMQKTDRAIVLTSHSMEECEALCNRLAIMVKGQFVCIGENQYLKQKFGQGFTVMIKLKDMTDEDEQASIVKNEFEKMFNRRNCDLKDQHHGLLHYHLTDPNIPWKDLFINMETLKSRLEAVEDYTVSETTLEQVFLSFAKRDAQ